MPITEAVNNVTNDNYILLPENNEDYITINASDARVGINVNAPDHTIDISKGTVCISNGDIYYNNGYIQIENENTRTSDALLNNNYKIKIINGIIVDISYS